MSMGKNLKVFREKDLRALKARIHKIERPKKRRSESLTLGLKAIDSTLPEGGIASSAVHEVTGLIYLPPTSCNVFPRLWEGKHDACSVSALASELTRNRNAHRTA